MMAAVERVRSYDGTELAYRLVGQGPLLLCVPGGPGRAAAYLGDLGGLSGHRRLVLLDNRGTGHSAVPADPASYRADRLVDEVEGVRADLDLDRGDLLGQSAGGGVAMMYAARFPERVGRMVLVTPGLRAVGIELNSQDWLASLAVRAGQEWYGQAYQAARRLAAGDQSLPTYHAVGPFYYGRWDEAAAAHFTSAAMRRSPEVMAGFFAEGAYDPARVRAGLAALRSPVLVLAGELDPSLPPRLAAELTGLFPRGELVIQPGGGHYPWLDDP